MSRPDPPLPPPSLPPHPALPPHQFATRGFPRIGEREPEPFDPATWDLRIDGCVSNALSLSIDEFRSLPRVTSSGTIHCVTRWSRPGTSFRGVALSELLRRAQPAPTARFVRFVSGRGHDTSLPLALATSDVLMADEVELDGAWRPLPGKHGGPVRSVLYTRYFYKSVKWLRRIELLEHDQLGCWEREAGYHNRADPWKEERYVVRHVDRARLRALLTARDLAGEDLLGADLTGMDLSGMTLRNASLRNASLERANLRGADLRGANLTNARATDADLRDAQLDGVDLDAADLRGADLRGSTGAPSSLACTHFVSADGERGARLGPLDWRASPVDGLIAAQQAFLLETGVRLRESAGPGGPPRGER